MYIFHRNVGGKVVGSDTGQNRDKNIEFIYLGPDLFKGEHFYKVNPQTIPTHNTTLSFHGI